MRRRSLPNKSRLLLGQDCWRQYKPTEAKLGKFGVPLYFAAFFLLGLSLATAQQSALPDRLVGHGGPVKSVQLDRSGTRALTSSFDYSIMLWKLDGNAGEILKRMIGHNAAVNDIAFVYPGKETQEASTTAVSVSDDGSLGIWDIDTGKLVTLISDGEEKMLDVSVSSDGSLAAAAKWDSTARVYDLASRTQIRALSGHRGPVNAVAFSNDDKTLFSASYDGDIRIWHLADNGALSNYQNGSILHSNGWGINVLAVLPETGNLVFGSVNGLIGLYDFMTDEFREIGSFEKPVLSLAISEAAGWLAAGSGDGFIRVYDLQTFEMIEEHRDAAGPVWGMAFSADGKRIFKAGLDDFVTHWHVSPRKAIEVSQSEYPRRFQLSDSSDPGEVEFRRKCSVCHTLVPDDLNRAGPTLYGIFGRKAGTVEGYVYSDALKNSDIIWNEVTISRLFDEGPDIVTPGTKMPIQRLKSVERRNDLIAYLKRVTAVSD